MLPNPLISVQGNDNISKQVMKLLKNMKLSNKEGTNSSKISGQDHIDNPPSRPLSLFAGENWRTDHET